MWRMIAPVSTARMRSPRQYRPLWASTSTKDPAYPDLYYVEALIAPFHERVNLRAPVRRVHRVPDGVVIALDDSCERFDEVVQQNGWTFGRRGNGYVALWSWRWPPYPNR